MTPDLIYFTPTVTYADNPTGSKPKATQTFTINMNMVNSKGQPIHPSSRNPIHVDVYGAPDGVIMPTSTITNTKSVTFTYNGHTFPNNIMINAWISDPTNNGAAIGQTQILQKNPLSCSYGPVSYQVPLYSGLPGDLMVYADVGYTTSSPTSTLAVYSVDTGSLGVIVPVNELPDSANVIGPGPTGYQYYDSSGNTYYGNYYLATVRVQINGGTTVQTPPILVLGISSAACTGPITKSCHSSPPPLPNLHYLGVGFDRPGAGNPTDLFHSPTANAFLHITNGNNGTDMSPGYYLTPNDSTAQSPNGITLGINSIANYSVVNLQPSPTVPSDFATEYGCFTFTGTVPAAQFCGTLLLDVGIGEMLINLPKSQWPAGVYDQNNMNYIVVGTPMTITAGTGNQLNYSFTAVQYNCPPYPPSTGSNNVAPCYAQLIDSTSTGTISVNTGRRPLFQWDYFYQGQCGQVGFYQF